MTGSLVRGRRASSSCKSFLASFWRFLLLLAWPQGSQVTALTFPDNFSIGLILITLPTCCIEVKHPVTCMPIPSPHALELHYHLLQSLRVEENSILGSSSCSKLTHFWLLPLSLWAWHTFLRSQDWRQFKEWSLLYSKSTVCSPQTNLSLLNVNSVFLRCSTWDSGTYFPNA